MVDTGNISRNDSLKICVHNARWETIFPGRKKTQNFGQTTLIEFWLKKHATIFLSDIDYKI